jgi:hypothetical protein
MFCGFDLMTPQRGGEKTIMEGPEATVCESSDDVFNKTKLLSAESFSEKPQDIVKSQKPVFFAWLVSLGEPDKDRDYRITKEKTTIGKSKESDIVIGSDFISRNHAMLAYEKGKFVLNDLESTNHTFVNGEKISKQILKDSDLIKFGEATYKFKCL